MVHYTEEQKKTGLEMLVECRTVTEAAPRLGHPSRSVFYRWIEDDDAARKRVEGRMFSH